MMNKTKLVLGIATATLTMAAAMVAPQAQAHSKAKKHSHRAVTYTTSSAERLAEAANNKVEALEAQLQAMQYELQALRSEAHRPASDADSAKVQELDQWMASVKAAPMSTKARHDNTLFFHGGYAHQNNDRGGTLDPTNIPGIGSNRDGLTTGPIADADAWYFGAGFDFGLTDDVWGMMNNTEVLAELMFDYTELGDNANNGLSAQEVGVVNGIPGAGFNLPPANNEKATVNMLRLTASPKVKLFKNSAFRPWLIPVGFELAVISPPSDAITVLTPAMQFGIGADYRIWKDIFIGADARYHYAPGNVDGVEVSGVTAGGYIGIGF
ncbi:MAG: porin family protein [Methylovulum sp.]|nr:porin family protein [Methylovulum sp.]